MKTSRLGVGVVFSFVTGVLFTNPILQGAVSEWNTFPKGNSVVINGEYQTPNDPRPNRPKQTKAVWKVEGAVVGGSMQADMEQLFSRSPAQDASDVRISAKVPVRSLTMFTPTTTTWLHGFLKYDKHPNIEFELQQFKVLSVDEKQTLKAEATGRLSMAGASHPVTVPVTLSRNAEGHVIIEGAFTIDLSLYLTLPQKPFRMFSDKPPTIHDSDDLPPTKKDAQVTFRWCLQPKKVELTHG